MNGDTSIGSSAVRMPDRMLSVCRSGTVATKSEPRASDSAAENPSTVIAKCVHGAAPRIIGSLYQFRGRVVF